MGRKFYANASNLQIWKARSYILQVLPKSTNRWTNVHGVVSDKTSLRWEGGSILWTYIKTIKSPTTSRHRIICWPFFVNMTIVISLDRDGGDEGGHLAWT
jgi:hypothetical protein